MASQFCGRTRREFLWQAGGGFGATALSGILPTSFFRGQSLAAEGTTPFRNPLASRPPHFTRAANPSYFCLCMVDLVRSTHLIISPK